MSELTLIEEQRGLLRTLHSLITQRKEAEADANARFRSEREAAEEDLREVQQQADAQLDRVDQVRRQAVAQLDRIHAELEEYLKPDTFGGGTRWSIHGGTDIDEIRQMLEGGRPTELEERVRIALASDQQSTSPDQEIIRYISKASQALEEVEELKPQDYRGLTWSWLGGKEKFRRSYTALLEAATSAELWYEHWLKQAQETYQQQLAEAQVRYRQAMDEIRQTFQDRIARLPPVFTEFTGSVTH